MPMRAGQLRHRVTIQSPVQSQNETGEVELAWVDLCSLWASVEPLTGRELLRADRVESELTHRVRLRHDSRVSSRLRIVHESRTLEIVSVANQDERNEQLEVMCREVH